MPDPTPDPKQAAALADLEASREAARVNDPYHYVRPEHEISERERLAEFAMAEYAKTPDGIREVELAQHRAAWKQDVANKAAEITATRAELRKDPSLARGLVHALVEGYDAVLKDPKAGERALEKITTMISHT